MTDQLTQPGIHEEEEEQEEFIFHEECNAILS